MSRIDEEAEVDDGVAQTSASSSPPSPVIQYNLHSKRSRVQQRQPSALNKRHKSQPQALFSGHQDDDAIKVEQDDNTGIHMVDYGLDIEITDESEHGLSTGARE